MKLLENLNIFFTTYFTKTTIKYEWNSSPATPLLIDNQNGYDSHPLSEELMTADNDLS